MSTNQLANRYDVLGTLGEGGMGQVLLVKDTATDREVALKLLKTQGSEKLLQQEFRTMTRLRHPRTVEVFDFGHLPDGAPYFTMEVVDGQDLSQLLPLEPDLVADVLAKACDALGYIHSQGYVHGDLKPANLRLMTSGDVKLMDFGLMERCGQGGGLIRGTPLYVAPEVVRGGPVDQRADLYSLGAVAYHLLTGRPPFEGETTVEVLKKHLHELPAPPSGYVSCPPELEEVVLRLLAKDSLERYQSTYDLVTALGRKAEAGRPLILAPSFVGRAGELGRLREAFNAMGTVPAVVITGDAGFGKSRLLSEFRVEIQLAEIPHASVTCREVSEAPYGPWIHILRQLLPLARYHAPRAAEAHTPVLASILPELGDAMPPLEPREEAHRLESAVVDLVYAIAEAKALVIFIEDLQWLEPRSRDILTHLLRVAEGRSLLVVATARTMADDSPIGRLVSTMPLAGLRSQDLAQVVASALGGAEIPADFMAGVERISGGNPLFVEALLHHMAEAGTLRPEAGRWVVSALPNGLPQALRDSLLERVTRLPDGARELAGLLAALGRETGIDVLFEAWCGEREAFFEALEEVRGEGLVTGDLGVFAFAQPALREVCYAALPEDRRQVLHGRLGDVLERFLAVDDPERPGLLAHHFLASAERARALPYFWPAGLHAAQRFANEQARHFLASGLSLMDSASSPVDDRIEALTLLGDVCRLAGDTDAALEAYGAASRLATDVVRKARALSGMGRAHQIRAELEAARDVLSDALQLLDGQDEPALLCRVLCSLGRVAYFGQDIETSTAHYQAALETARAAGLEAQTAEALAFLGFAIVSVDEARLEEGLDFLHESLQIRQFLGDKLGLLDTYMLLGNAYLALGHYPEAQECFAHCRHLAYLTGHKDEETFAQLNLAIVALETGDFQTAGEMAVLAEAGSAATSSAFTGSMARGLRGIALLSRGEIGGAIDCFEGAKEQADTIAHQYLDIVLGGYEAEFLLGIGRAGEAREVARVALERAESSGNKETLPQLLTILGMIETALGNREQASLQLERAKDLATQARSKGGQAKALRALALFEVTGQEFEQAKEYALEALSLAEGVQAHSLMGELNYILGEAAHGLGLNGTAISAYRAAQVIADQKVAPDLLARAHVGLSHAEPTRAGYHMGLAREAVKRLLDTVPESHLETYKSRWEKDLWDQKPLEPRDRGPSLDYRLSRLQRDMNDFAGDLKKQQREHTELRGSHRNLGRLIDFSLTVNRLHELKDVLDRAIDLILDITGAERGFLLLFDGGTLNCQAYRNLYPEGRTALDFHISRTIADEVLRTEEPLCLVDAMSDDRFKDHESIQALQLRTVICVPLKIRDIVVGVVYVDRQTINDEFSERDLDLVLSLAALASNAIENANLHGEWQDKGRKLAMLNDLARTISTTLVMEEVLDIVVRMTLEVARAERGFLLLWESSQLHCRSALDKNGVALSHQTISMSICQGVVETGIAVCVTDAMSDEELSLKQSIMLMSLKTVMAVPLVAKGTMLGVLYVDSQAILNQFTQRDLELLEAIASHASVAIENAQLYQQLSRRAAELERSIGLYDEANMRSATDVLTGLYNRRFFQEELGRDFAAARRHRRDLSILMVDLDHFKSFNDTYGHHVGDAVLIAVTQVIQNCVRLADNIARFGGEEFVVNLPDTDLAGAKVVAERIRKGVTELQFEEGIRPITVSIGVASIQAQDERIAELIERADQALFKAKQNGRNRVEEL